MREAPYINYTLKTKPVPRIVLSAIAAAEESAYAKTSATRFIVEAIQDILVRFSPRHVYHKNYSVGTYRIKAKTAKSAIRWAIKRELLKIHDKNYKDYTELIPLFVMSPRYNEDITRVVLTQIKEKHPILRKLRWQDIQKDDYLIAKIYSGYMGAGGNFNDWKKSITPGKEAQKRLKCKDGKCKTIQFLRSN